MISDFDRCRSRVHSLALAAMASVSRQPTGAAAGYMSLQPADLARLAGCDPRLVAALDRAISTVLRGPSPAALAASCAGAAAPLRGPRRV